MSNQRSSGWWTRHKWFVWRPLWSNESVHYPNAGCLFKEKRSCALFFISLRIKLPSAPEARLFMPWYEQRSHLKHCSIVIVKHCGKYSLNGKKTVSLLHALITIARWCFWPEITFLSVTLTLLWHFLKPHAPIHTESINSTWISNHPRTFRRWWRSIEGQFGVHNVDAQRCFDKEAAGGPAVEPLTFW